MKRGRRFGFSAEQKLDVWHRWKAGQTLHEIGRAFGKEHSSIRCLVSRHDGIAPAVRRRTLLALTLRERDEVSRGLASGLTIRPGPRNANQLSEPQPMPWMRNAPTRANIGRHGSEIPSATDIPGTVICLRRGCMLRGRFFR
jgi:hypothetical protein